MGIRRFLILSSLLIVLEGCTSAVTDTSESVENIDAIDLIINDIDDLEDYRYDDEN